MSAPSEPDDVKLIASLFSADKQLINVVSEKMEDLFGPIDWQSPWLLFDRTRYYEKEMGWPLHRRFISFKNLIRPEKIADIKVDTNLANYFIPPGNQSELRETAASRAT